MRGGSGKLDLALSEDVEGPGKDVGSLTSRGEWERGGGDQVEENVLCLMATLSSRWEFLGESEAILNMIVCMIQQQFFFAAVWFLV